MGTNFQGSVKRYLSEDIELELAAEEGLSIASDVEIDRELSARSLREYVELTWPQIEPARPFVGNWHIDAICEHLEAVTAQEITRLVINVPPGSMKSLLACVFWPSWMWTKKPETKLIYGSYADRLAKRDALRHRRLTESRWYQERWGHVCKPRKADEWTAVRFANTANGFRISTTIDGQVTGDHADIQVVDDPLKPREVTGSMAVSKNALERCVTWWDETMATRLQDFAKSARVIIMQRLHEGDLAGHVLKAGGYEHLCLPMEFEPTRRCKTFLFTDPRKTEGELLWPRRFDAASVDNLKKELGPRGTAAQLQQTPSPAGGAIFKRDSWKWYGGDSSVPVPDWKKGLMVQSWDCSFKDTDDSDYVSGQIWSMIGPDFYLIDFTHERLSFSKTTIAIEWMHSKWPRAIPILIEDKANGTAVIDVLKQKIAGVKAVNPRGGKEARANAVEPLFDCGNIYLPHPTLFPRVNVLIEEMMSFPAGVHDDQVDAMTQALTYLQLRSFARYRKAMQNAAADAGKLNRVNGARSRVAQAGR